MTEPTGPALGAEQITRLRHALLGRPPEEHGDPDREAAQSDAELRHAAGSPNALVEVVTSWIHAPEFVYRWPRNPLFRDLQAVEHLDTAEYVDRPIVHVHVPKTAGTSMNEAIGGHFGPNESLYGRPTRELLAMPLARLMGLRFLAGHHGFSGADLMRHRDPLVVSMARDPFDLYPSMWRYYRKLDILPPTMSLEQWLRERAKPNLQSRMFLLNIFEGNREEPRTIDAIDQRRSEAMIADHLPVALDRIHLLAPTERAAELYLEIHRTMRLPGDPVPFPRLNTTEPAPISDEARALIADKCRVDQQYYAAAAARWAAHTGRPTG